MNVGILDLETSMKPLMFPWMTGAFLSTIGLQVYLDTGKHYYKEWVYQHQERPNIMELDRLNIIWELQEHLDNVDLITGHNIKFDINWIKSKNIIISGKKLWCTAIGDYMLNGQEKIGYSLSACCERHGLPVKTDKVKAYWDAGIDTNKVPLRTLLPYQKNDVLITADLFKKQYVEMKRRSPNMFKLAEERNYCLHSVSDIELNGMPMDRELAEKNVAFFQDQLVETDDELLSYFGRPDVNIGSRQELSACLFGGILKRERNVPLIYTRNVTIKEPYKFTYKSGKLKGNTVTKYKNRTLRELLGKKRKEDYAVTLQGAGFAKDPKQACKRDNVPTGYYKTGKDVLKVLKCNNDGGTTAQHKRKILDLLVHRSKIGKFTSTFIGSKDDTGLFYNVDMNADGIPHPSYNQCIASTSRMTSSNPNGQNFPRSKEDEDGFTNPLKRIFVPSRPGGLILVVDLSQLEWRVAAWLSQDPTAMAEIINGVDCHADNAINFFGDIKYRQDAKIFTFRLLYGGSAYAFYMDPKMPNFTLKKWTSIVAQYRMKYNILTAWQDRNIMSVPGNGGFLYSPTGRCYKIPMEPHKKYPDTMIYKETCIKNYPVQGTATGDIVPIAMNELDDRMISQPQSFMSTNWMGQVHDSVIFDTMPGEVKRTAFTAIQVFEDLPVIISDMFNVDFNLPMTGEAEAGPNYGELTWSVKHENGEWITKGELPC